MMINRRSKTKLPNGLCVDCNDDLLKPVIGKRDQARCVNHYWSNLRSQSDPIDKRSKEQEAKDRLYHKIRNEVLAERPYCEIRFDGCTHIATTTHHSLGHGDHYLDKESLIPACLPCHIKAEANPKAARENKVTGSRLTNSLTNQ